MKDKKASILSSTRIHANMANSHCPIATGHTSSALLNRRVSFDVTVRCDLTLWPLCTRQEWAAGLNPTEAYYFLHTATYAPAWPGKGCVCLRVRCGCVPVHVSKCMLFPWLCGPDAENVPGLQCVSCLGLHVSPSSALHFLPSRTPR